MKSPSLFFTSFKSEPAHRHSSQIWYARNSLRLLRSRPDCTSKYLERFRVLTIPRSNSYKTKWASADWLSHLRKKKPRAASRTFLPPSLSPIRTPTQKVSAPPVANRCKTPPKSLCSLMSPLRRSGTCRCSRPIGPWSSPNNSHKFTSLPKFPT